MFYLTNDFLSCEYNTLSMIFVILLLYFLQTLFPTFWFMLKLITNGLIWVINISQQVSYNPERETLLKYFPVKFITNGFNLEIMFGQWGRYGYYNAYLLNFSVNFLTNGVNEVINAGQQGSYYLLDFFCEVCQQWG